MVNVVANLNKNEYCLCSSFSFSCCLLFYFLIIPLIWNVKSKLLFFVGLFVCVSVYECLCVCIKMFYDCRRRRRPLQAFWACVPTAPHWEVAQRKVTLAFSTERVRERTNRKNIRPFKNSLYKIYRFWHVSSLVFLSFQSPHSVFQVDRSITNPLSLSCKSDCILCYCCVVNFVYKLREHWNHRMAFGDKVLSEKWSTVNIVWPLAFFVQTIDQLEIKLANIQLQIFKTVAKPLDIFAKITTVISSSSFGDLV